MSDRIWYTVIGEEQLKKFDMQNTKELEPSPLTMRTQNNMQQKVDIMHSIRIETSYMKYLIFYSF